MKLFFSSILPWVLVIIILVNRIDAVHYAKTHGSPPVTQTGQPGVNPIVPSSGSVNVNAWHAVKIDSSKTSFGHLTWLTPSESSDRKWCVPINGTSEKFDTIQQVNVRLANWGIELRPGPPPDTGLTAWITEMGEKIWDAL